MEPFILAPQSLPSPWQWKRHAEGLGIKCLGPGGSQILHDAALHAFPPTWVRCPSLETGLSSLKAGEGKLVGAVLSTHLWTPSCSVPSIRRLDCRGDLSDTSLRRKRQRCVGRGAGTGWIFTRQTVDSTNFTWRVGLPGSNQRQVIGG